jgi:hypothetical protein
MLICGSPQLFQNAAGFEIVGGQFVLGDVHNHTNVSSLVRTRYVLLPRYIYCREVQYYPVYNPF